MKKLNVVQIGFMHEHANGKIATLRKMTDTYNIVGVVDERPFSTTPFYLDYSNLFEDLPHLTLEQVFGMSDLDAVLVEVPNLDLVPVAMQVMEHNLPMHLDKPAGYDLALYKKLLDGCKAKNLPLQMGYMFRGNPVFKFIRHLVENNAFGEIFSIDMDMDHCYGGAHYEDYLSQLRGGIMFNLGCHLIDFIVALLGEPEKVHPFLKTTTQAVKGAITNSLAVLEYPHATANVRACCPKPGPKRHCRIGGTKGCCEFAPLEMFNGQPLVLEMFVKDAVCGFQPGQHKITFPPQHDRYIVQLQELADVIQGTAKPEYSYEHDYIVHKVTLEAAGIL
ncbi:MAG: Gfo/Idh/MocA family oxidoreductase [Victivallales bacterium]|nr:Gfo/Idh/MocA family oxidoreductase [Victivallales bacterium]